MLENIPGWYYGEYWHDLTDSPIVQISNGTDTGFDTSITRSDSDKLCSLSIDLANFNVDYSRDIGCFWATATCANDIIEGTAPVNPVPEPATMLLLGAGLVGLAGFGRKKFIK